MIIPAKPELGMVISYSFLWKREYQRGETSGRKDRPVAIVVIRSDIGPADLVYAVPITHSESSAGDMSRLPVPRSIKQRLGLDDEPSWIDVSEYNAFVWPGPDLRPTVVSRQSLPPTQQTCLYGFLPKRYFAKVRQALDEYRLSHKPRLSLR